MRNGLSLSRAKGVLDFAVSAAIGVAAVLLIWRALGDPPIKEPPVRPAVVQDVASSDLVTSIDGAPRLGNATAPVVLIEYSDFECPFCARHATGAFGSIRDEFVSKGTLQYVFRQFPIEQIHPSAVKAAQAAECAHRQGKFMEMRAQLFGAQKALAQMDWALTASQLELDPARFGDCLSAAVPATLHQETEEARRLGAASTPTFLLGTRDKSGQVKVLVRLTGAQPYALFREQIEQTIKAVSSTSG